MATDIYLGFNTHIDVANRVYVNYSSATSAFNDIKSILSLGASYGAPLHWREDNTVEFVATSSNQGMETYCCWDMGYTGVSRKKYGFGIIIGSRYTGQDARKKKFKYIARRDFMTEFLSEFSFSYCQLDRYTVPSSEDVWGAFPEDEPVALKNGFSKIYNFYPYSSILDEVTGTVGAFYPVLSVSALPKEISATTSNWADPEPLRDGPLESKGLFQTAVCCYVPSIGGSGLPSVSNAWTAFRTFLENCEKAGVDFEKYVSSVSLVPVDLCGLKTINVDQINQDTTHSISTMYIYECFPSFYSDRMNLSNGAYDNEKMKYYNGSVAIFSGGKKYAEFYSADCASGEEVDAINISMWSMFSGIPCLKARVAFSPDQAPLRNAGLLYSDGPWGDDGRSTIIPFPTIYTSTDTFQEWWRSNKNQQSQNNINLGVGIGSTVVGIATAAIGIAAAPVTAGASAVAGVAAAGSLIGGVSTIASSVGQIKNFNASISAAKANSVSSVSLAGSDIDPFGSLISFVSYGPIDRDRDVMNKFLRRYGYNYSGGVAIPKRDNGLVYTYIKGNVSMRYSYVDYKPSDEGERYIIQQFEEGVTLWRPEDIDSFGNFNQNNYPYRN